MPLQLEIVTPEARIFSDEVDAVVLPGTEGEMGVLPAHSSLVTALKRAQERLESIKHDSHTEEVAMVQAMIQKSMAQLHVKRRRKGI